MADGAGPGSPWGEVPPRPALAPATLPDFCGPDELAKVVLMMRRWERQPELEGCVSESGMRRLFELAFQTSLSTEEGRHPRFRFFVSAPSSDPSAPPIARFDPPIPLRPDSLRRMIPAVSSRLHALKVVESKNGALFADSVLAVDEMGDTAGVGRPEISMGLGLPGLMVRVDGPGRMRATEKGSTWELRDGRVRPLNHYAVISSVRKWFTDLARALLQETGASAAAELTGESDPAIVFDAVWSSILSGTVAAGHGGAFAILPGEPGPEIHIKYAARDLDLARAVTGFWRECFDADRERDVRAIAEKSARWESARRRMFSSARALSELANVDGCVVLDRRLRLFGFGAEIRVGAETVEGWECAEAHPETLETQARIDVERWGTRHRSAFRLCCVRPGTMVFVVSQDGDLRVFQGDPERRRVCAWQSLGAWMSAADRW
jgi:hypothetical protein